VSIPVTDLWQQETKPGHYCYTDIYIDNQAASTRPSPFIRSS